MITPELQRYIQAHRASGASDKLTTAALLKAGWSQEDIAKALRAKPSSSKKMSKAIQRGLVLAIILVAIIVSIAAFYQKHSANQTVSYPSGLAKPYAISDNLEVVTGWVRPNQTSCTDLIAQASPVSVEATNEQQKQLGGDENTFLPVKVGSDGTFKLVVDKKKNVSVSVLSLKSTHDTCLAATFLASSNTPLVLDADSTALSLVSSATLSDLNSDQLVGLQKYDRYTPFKEYLRAQLPKISLTEIVDPTGSHYSEYSTLFTAYNDERSKLSEPLPSPTAQ